MTSDDTETTITANGSAETAFIRALDEHVEPLTTDDPTVLSDDLDVFYDRFSDKRIIGLGEATHGTREFFRLKHRLIRYLVEELGYRIVGLEANFSETRAINEYILHGENTPEQALDATKFWVWLTEEIVAMLKWLRAYNLDKPEDERVIFYGFDAQFTGGPASALADFLDVVDPDTLENVGSDLAILKDGLRSSDKLDTKLERAGAVIDELHNCFNRNEQRYTEATSISEFELACHHLRVLEQAYVVNEKRHRDTDHGSARDKFMAENVSWILNYEERDKIVLWAHNDHVRRGGPDDSPVLDSVPMGHHLDEAFGGDYYALGFDFGSGSFQAQAHPESSNESGITEFSVDTLSYNVLDESTERDTFSRDRLPDTALHDVLHGVDNDLFFLDLETVMADASLRDWIKQIQLCYSIGAVFGESDLVYTHLPIRVTEEFDGLLFVRETNRARKIETG